MQRKDEGGGKNESSHSGTRCDRNGRAADGSEPSRSVGAGTVSCVLAASRNRGKDAEGSLSTVIAGLRIQKSRPEGTRPGARNFLLQVLVLPQRIYQGHPETHWPLPAHCV